MANGKVLSGDENRPDSKQIGTKVNTKVLKRQLVPPPPPTVPLSNSMTFLSGAPLELLSQSDLKAKRDALTTEMAAAQEKLKDKELIFAEKKERLDLFASLYKEGVVSRRELEGIGKEVSQAEAELREDRRKTDELMRDLSKINGFLKQVTVSKSAKSFSTYKNVAKK